MSKPASDPEGEDLDLPQNEDIEGLQQQFQQQQKLIAQLKGALQSNEQQLATKEKEVGEYAAKLSSIKSRTKGSKLNSRSSDIKSNVEAEKGKEETSTETLPLEATSKQELTQTPSPIRQHKQEESVSMVQTEGEKKDYRKSAKNSEKSRLLRKKLEENRMKFEQRGKEISESKKGIEEMVENLRMQLEERDQVIQALQKGLESNIVTSVPDQAYKVEMTDVNVEETDPREMYAQIVYKDNKIVELNNRIMELEVKILDLQENVKEKDAVIDARTKAITLMSEDLSRKSKTTLDTLDDTREQMRLMQNNFIVLEGRMKDENEQMKKKLDEKDRKIKHIEEANGKLESVRFELTTNIAELQEKVVHLQTMNSALQKQADEKNREREMRGEKKDQVHELLQALDESNKQMLRIKAQNKNKVKSLTKQIESLKKVSESGDEILRLEQRIAELEEDKGNLQLHLVDFDELKATEKTWKERVKELEERVKQQNQDLDLHVKALSQLENEKLNLMEELHSGRLQHSELGAEIDRLRSKLTELEDLKVSIEMKAVELEEVIDMLTREKNVLLHENKTLMDDKNEYKQLLESVQQEKAELLEEITSLQNLLKESNPNDTDSNRSEFQMVSSNNSDEEKWRRLPTPEENLPEEKHVKDSSNVELYVKLLESELEDARKVISEEKDTIHDLKLKLESKEEEIEMHLEVISKLEQLGSEVSSQQVGDAHKISEVLKELNEMTGDLEEWKNRCTEVENRLKCLEDEKVSLDRKLEEVTNENSVLTAQVSLQKQVSEDLVSQLNERNKIISEKEETINELLNTNIHEEKEKALCDQTEALKLEETSPLDTSSNSEDVCLKVQLDDLKKTCVIYEKEISEINFCLSQTKVELQQKQEAVANLERKLQESDEKHFEQFQEALKEKEVLLEGLKSECHDLKSSLETLREDMWEKAPHEEPPINKDEIENLEQLLSEKNTLLSEKENELENMKQKLRNATEKVKKLAVNLKAKSTLVQSFEEKEKSFFENIQEKEELISKLNVNNENLCKELEELNSQCEEKEKTVAVLKDKCDSIIQSHETTIQELLAQKMELATANQNLIDELSTIKEKRKNDSQVEEEQKQILISQISMLENEVVYLRQNLDSKGEEVNLLRSECIRLTVFEEERKFLMESNAQSEIKNQELMEAIMKKDGELSELSKQIEEKNEQIEMSFVKCKELQQMILSKEMQVTALEDRMSVLQNSWSALEAKLLEREAVIESLEQELEKSRLYQQNLEDGLSFIEERRRSLENKFSVLGEQLQESDRIKVEAEEHEGELENRLAALASSEEILRKKLENLNEQNIELSQKITELSTENEGLKRNIANTDQNLKIASKEVDRLANIEKAYLQALDCIEELEHNLKIRTAEFERISNEKDHQSRQNVETLELDVKNLGKQLEILENEKRSVLEHCETLNDIKMNLEDEVDTLQNKNYMFLSKIAEFEQIFSQRQLDMHNLAAEKQRQVTELNDKIRQLEERIEHLIRDAQPVDVQTQNKSDDVDIQHLKSEIDSLTKVLTEKETEIQSYQNRMLQLQFGEEGNSSSVAEEREKLNALENSLVEMQEAARLKEIDLEELRRLLESTNCNMKNVQSQLEDSKKIIEEKSREMSFLREVTISKDNISQEPMHNVALNSEGITEQLNSKCNSNLLDLQQKLNHLHQELVQEKAKNIVSDIVRSAENFAQCHVKNQGKNNVAQPAKQTKVHFSNDVSYSAVKFDDEPQEADRKQQSQVFNSEEVDFSCIHNLENKKELGEIVRNELVKPTSDKQFSKEACIESQNIKQENQYKVFTFDYSETSPVLDLPIEQLGSVPNIVEISTPKEVDTPEAIWTEEVLASGEDEEGWGLGAEEAQLEAEHMERQKAAYVTTPEQHNELQLHIVELEDKINSIEKEKSKIIDELKASQIRSGKMLKKLKDMKINYEKLLQENQELVLKKSSEFGSLDLAIEEELKIRIDSLEKELKECKGEKDAVIVEKESLQKRVESLTATNERLCEREQLGTDITFWQNKAKELNNQVEMLQWKLEELIEEKETERSENKILNVREFQEQIAALGADNEQLQSLLEEQRNLRVAAEVALKDLQLTPLKEVNYLQESNINEKYIALKENYDVLCKELTDLRSHPNNDLLIAENVALRENYELLSKELEQLRSNSNSDIVSAYHSLQQNYKTIFSELEEMHAQVDASKSLLGNYESLQMAHDELMTKMDNVQKENCCLAEKYEAVVVEKCSLQDESNAKTKTIQDTNELMKLLEKENMNLTFKCEELSSGVSSLTSDVQYLTDEVEKYRASVGSMTQEIERLNEENFALSKKYELLKLENQQTTIEPINEPKLNIPVSENTFQPVQLFSKVKNEGKETSTNVSSSNQIVEEKKNIAFVEETFQPIQFFSKVDEEFIKIEDKPLDFQPPDLLEKNSFEKEVADCKMKIEELEEINEQKIGELRVLRDMFSREQEDWANLEQNLSKKIEILQRELDMLTSVGNQESEVRERLMLKEHELSSLKSELVSMEELLRRNQFKIEDLEAQLLQKEEELQDAVRNFENQENIMQQLISSKEKELNKLQEELIQKLQDKEELLLYKEKDIANLKLQIADHESEIENMARCKDEDIQNLKKQMSEKEQIEQALIEEKNKNIKELLVQLAESKELVHSLSQALKEKEQRISELEEVLEAREDEISEAVLQIRDKNREIEQLKQGSGVVFAESSTSQASIVPLVQDDGQSESSQLSELDLALYMLHQRDVRCEELTHELMQLLEERDTLQLRLSTALRINEDLRSKINKISNTSSPVRVPAVRSEPKMQEEDVSEKILVPIDPEPCTDPCTTREPREDLKALADKLSQLHSVDYRRDVTVQEEREQRHSEQVMLLQPRTPGVLVESSYTLSRDVQSPSTVLLNWIWGRSTPKVMHI